MAYEDTATERVNQADSRQYSVKLDGRPVYWYRSTATAARMLAASLRSADAYVYEYQDDGNAIMIDAYRNGQSLFA